MIIRKAPAGFLVTALASPRAANPTLTRQRLLFAVLCFVWGTTWIAMKIGIATVPPGFFAGTRWAAAGLALLAWRWLHGQPLGVPRRLFGRLLLVSIMMISLNAVIQLYGLRYVPAGLATVISSALTPISLVGFSVLLGQERFSARQAGALALGVAGILMVFGEQALGGRLGWPEILGAAGVIVGCLMYSLASVLARPLMRTLAPGNVAAVTNCIGGFLLLAASLLFEPGARAALAGDWGWQPFAAWLYLLIPGSLGATIIYFYLVRDWGAGRTGSYAFVSPVLGVVAAVLVLGEKINVVEVLGMVVMLAAAGLALRRPDQPAQRDRSSSRPATV